MKTLQVYEPEEYGKCPTHIITEHRRVHTGTETTSLFRYELYNIIVGDEVAATVADCYSLRDMFRRDSISPAEGWELDWVNY